MKTYISVEEEEMLKRLLLICRTKLGLGTGTQRMNHRQISMPLSRKSDNLSDELVLIHKRPKGFRRFVVI
jgi:hypothetical protein